MNLKMAMRKIPYTNQDQRISLNRNKGSIDNWGQVKKITASYRQEYDTFGSAVAMYGENAFVGASEEDDDESESNPVLSAGSAYVYKASNGGMDNWGFEKKK